ncbi:mononuclear molybdenum enzyme YedY [Helicobacter enhydrae]|uniref:Protein-methionine-sulfoxide reductase catalytic subunit MsrP n=1 Tax=Helicobacter enhydrae TaxID=222136 RepID=A0A1B1U5Z1_9HELI|nr:protein-methionine-sulfoxide reductase catalytic subunit MsrP [Helicobacter enhydrae]ANV98170.1 mononuclear molybdenum enzyme YedY [Helicobacter enhydrae]
MTPEFLFHQRRKFMKLGVGTLVSPLLLESLLAEVLPPLNYLPQNVDMKLTSEQDATSYNNFYEFGFGKSDPKKNAKSFNPKPWTLSITGEVKKPLHIELQDLLGKVKLQERVYRLRCVEAWSMTIPWIGFELRELLAMVQPTQKAKYVKFTTLYDPKQFPAQNSFFASIDFPYVEGLRLDEANHPLSILAVGMYGKRLLPQNGAPIRLVVPWKYGFKWIKSIAKIELVSERPISTWEKQNSREYGFYANVNPNLPHPRWSQAYERVIGERGRQKTLYLNGYADEVGHLYEGMNPKELY